MGRKESCPPDGQGLLQFTVKMASPTSPSSPIRRSKCYPFPPCPISARRITRFFLLQFLMTSFLKPFASLPPGPPVEMRESQIQFPTSPLAGAKAAPRLQILRFADDGERGGVREGNKVPKSILYSARATTGTGNDGRRQLPLYYEAAHDPRPVSISLPYPHYLPLAYPRSATGRSQGQSWAASGGTRRVATRYFGPK